MLTEQSIDTLRALIDAQPQPARDEMRGALDDIGRLIGSQSLLLRNMRRKLDNANIGIGAINSLVQQGNLDQLLGNLNPPKRNPFSMDEAKAATEQLVAKIESANDFANILKAVVQVAKVFI